MANVDFVELAIYCANRYKEAHTEKNSERYVGTLYVCIAEDNSIMCSKTPHILRSAHQCILIHERSELAISNWYSWYRVEFKESQLNYPYGELGFTGVVKDYDTDEILYSTST